MANSGQAAPTVTFHLPAFIGHPRSFANFRDDNGFENVVVSSPTGLHLLRLVAADDLQYMRPLEFGNCLDVVLINGSIDRSNNGGPNGATGSTVRNKFGIAALFRDGDDPADTTSSIWVFTSDDPMKDVVLSRKLTCDRAWGRVQRLAYSSVLDCIFFSSRIDHQLRGKYQIGAVWYIPISISGDDTYPPCSMAVRLINKRPGNMRHLAINDHLNLLAVSDWKDGSSFAVDLYNAVSGNHAFRITQGSAVGGWPCGTVWYPRGLAFDIKNRLFVVDETGRVQRFNLSSRRCEAVACQTLFDQPETIAVKGKQLFVMGSQFGRSKRIAKGGYLTVYRGLL